MMKTYINKTNLKLFFTLIIIFCILLSQSSFVLAVDDAVYVWSSSSNTLNITDDNIKPANNSTSTNNTSPNSDTTNTANTLNTTDTTNTTDSINDNNSLETNAVSNVTDDNSLNLESASGILIEQSSGRILYAHNIHEQLRPASVTKVMSILLIMEAIDSGKISLTDEVPCSENAASMGGSQIWLDTSETLTVDEMLKAICVNSANDCVVAMAEYIAGSEDAFVQMMNDRAYELGMSDTTFKNCHGLDEDGHVTSSYDIAVMSRELLTKYPDITNYTSIWMDTLRNGETRAF